MDIQTDHLPDELQKVRNEIDMVFKPKTLASTLTTPVKDFVPKTLLGWQENSCISNKQKLLEW